jgi:polar amino acid transport system substrate-binding protein
MKKNSLLFILAFIASFFSGCVNKKEENNSTLRFAVSAEYPPFEFYKNGGELAGFDIELARAVAKKLGKTAAFEELEFTALLAALSNGSVDAAISTLTITKERQKNFDFSNPYFQESLAIISHELEPVEESGLLKSNIGCQQGSAMEMWLKNNYPHIKPLTMANNNQIVETLKAGHINAVLIDVAQAKAFCKQNPTLRFVEIKKSDERYGIALRKGSPLKKEIDEALDALEKEGFITSLVEKWIKE